MKILALIIVFLGFLLFVFFLRVYLELSYTFQDYESKLSIRIKILFVKYETSVIIPKRLLQKYYKDNIVNIFSESIEQKEYRKKEGREEKKITSKEKIENKQQNRRKPKFEFGKLFKHYVSSWADIIYFVKHLNRIKKYFYSKINVYSLKVGVELGGRDAAETGIFTGMIWFFWGQMTARMFQNFTVKKNDVCCNIIPNFENAVFSFHIKGILSLRISHIIFTAYKLLAFIVKRRLENYGRASN